MLINECWRVPEQPCADNASYVDEGGYSCSDWSPEHMVCASTSTRLGYSANGREELLSMCPSACDVCDPSVYADRQRMISFKCKSIADTCSPFSADPCSVGIATGLVLCGSGECLGSTVQTLALKVLVTFLALLARLWEAEHSQQYSFSPPTISVVKYVQRSRFTVRMAGLESHYDNYSAGSFASPDFQLKQIIDGMARYIKFSSGQISIRNVETAPGCDDVDFVPYSGLSCSAFLPVFTGESTSPPQLTGNGCDTALDPLADSFLLPVSGNSVTTV